MGLFRASRPPGGYWIVALLALAWMGFGLFALVMDYTMDEAGRAQMTAAQQQLMAARPAWLFGVYAVAIFSGLAGAIGLIMRQTWAVPAFSLSLLAIIVQFGYIIVGLDAVAILGAQQALLFPAVIFAIGVFLLWFATHARKRGWLR